MSDSVYEAQLRRQLYEARQEIVGLRADRARLEDEVGPLRQQLAEANARAKLAERQAAERLPLICSDERHQAKVQALQAQLVGLHGAGPSSCDHRDPKRLGARPGDLAVVCACGAEVFPGPFPEPEHECRIWEADGEWNVSCTACPEYRVDMGSEHDCEVWADDHDAKVRP